MGVLHVESGGAEGILALAAYAGEVLVWVACLAVVLLGELMGDAASSTVAATGGSDSLRYTSTEGLAHACDASYAVLVTCLGGSFLLLMVELPALFCLEVCADHDGGPVEKVGKTGDVVKDVSTVELGCHNIGVGM